MNSEIKIIECPRDAMQGIKKWIPTSLKIEYINALLKVGYDTLDAGGFVSSKIIPQMADSSEVLQGLDLSNTKTKLSVIIANERGAKEASKIEQINYFGYPFSISETFQVRNTNATLKQSIELVASIKEIAESNGKEFVAYLSMAFGNPYGDPWSIEIAEHWIEELNKLSVKYISFSDTIGVATPDVIEYFFSNLTAKFPDIEFGAHFHTSPETWREKVEAAFNNGCKRFDGAIKGFGGCPMAKDDLIGNMPTENLVAYFDEQKVETGLNIDRFNDALRISQKVFPTRH